MENKNPFLQLTLPRVKEALGRLKSLFWSPVGSVDVTLFEPSDGRPFSSMKYGLTPDKGESGLWLNWHHRGESTLYAKGTPYAGFDREHSYHPLPQGDLIMDVRDMTGEDRLIDAGLYRREEDAWRAYYDLEVLYDLALTRTERPSTMRRKGWELVSTV